MKKVLFFNLLLLALLTGMPAAVAQKVVLSGRVHTEQGNPVSGATLTFYNNQNQRLGDCSTNSSGEFRLDDRQFQRGMTIRAEVSADGYQTFSREYPLRTGRFGTITLKRLTGSRIRGTVKTDQGAYLQGVTVTFTEPSGEKRGVSNTDVNGAFQSDAVFKNGETITVTAQRPDFSVVEKTVRTGASGFVTVDFILETRTNISGFVIDSVSLEPVAGAEVSFFDRDSRLITTRTTDQRGYYDFDNPFTLGDIVRVHLDKRDYRSKEQTIIIAKGINRLDFKLLKKIDEGIKVVVRVYSRKGRKPLEGAKIAYQNRGSQERLTNRDGETQFRINQRGGFDLPLRIIKPGYLELKGSYRLTEDIDNFVDVGLYRDKTICPCFLYGGIGFAVASGASYGLSRKPYNDYKNYENLNRQDDYDKANRLVRIGTVAAGAAGASLTAWIICKVSEKKRLQRQNEALRNGISLAPVLPSADQGLQLGVSYRF